MRYQSNRASCGPAALSNALSALGIERSEDELIGLARQTVNGTTPRGIIKAIQSISSPDQLLIGEAIRWTNPEAAIIGVWYYISSKGRPAILCVDKFEHWVVCVGHLGARFMVVDSAEIGLVFHYSGEELVDRWEGPKGGYHAIIV